MMEPGKRERIDITGPMAPPIAFFSVLSTFPTLATFAALPMLLPTLPALATLLALFLLLPSPRHDLSSREKGVSLTVDIRRRRIL